MSLSFSRHSKAVSALLAGLSVVAGTFLAPTRGAAQPDAALAAQLNKVPLPEPSMYALPLPEDRGQAELVRALKELNTTASVLYIVAHPDDEDGALLTYLSRGMGARATLLTLTRGEGGQNAMSAEQNDAMGLIRTQELLKADEYYGVSQLWGTEADFGFSKTEEEAMKNWGHERVLFDAVLAIRKVRPQVIVATFVGGVSDGHGQHQVSGEIAQEAFKAAADPKVFPEQLKNGLEPWQAQAVYSRIPFARISPKGIFDYATGKWAPARFHNYVTGEWTNGPLSTDVTVPVGTWDPVLGRTYVQIAREGWGMQKSQYGGASPALDGPEQSYYHLWGAAAGTSAGSGDGSLFDNAKVKIDTSVSGLARLAGDHPPAWLRSGLEQIQSGVQKVQDDCRQQAGETGAKDLAPVYRQALDLYGRIDASDLSAEAKSDLEFELAAKIDEFQTAFKELLGLDLIAFRTRGGEGQGMGPRGGSADETPAAVTPGEQFKVRAHLAQAATAAALAKVWLVSHSGSPWKAEEAAGDSAPTAPVADRLFDVQAPQDAEPTKPYFTRPDTEQPYYDISNPAWRERSFMPWPLQAWAEFTFDGVPIRIGGTVQTLQRFTGPGGIYQPLVVTPAIGVRVQPEARLLPLDGAAVPMQVTVQTEQAAEGTVTLKLPQGWSSTPSEAHFARKGAGETEPLNFSVKPQNPGVGAYTIEAVAQSDGKDYSSGWHNVSYPGLLPYNQYEPADLKTREVDVKLAPGLRVGYVMGTGDTVPEAIQELGVTPHLLTDTDLQSGDLSQWNTIIIGIRAYTSRPALTMAQPRLDEFVRQGGTLIVQYQSATFPAPLPLAMGRTPERVVDETDPVKILDPANPLLSWPNKITSADFNGWFEERGHSFLDSWDPGYTALTETADPGQAPQQGGWIVTHPGKGTYVYIAYALYRQLPELVPGSYRILANLLSAGHEGTAGAQSAQLQRP
jgi:LmbE family N-acetylglucosaminyl deacetylase